LEIYQSFLPTVKSEQEKEKKNQILHFNLKIFGQKWLGVIGSCGGFQMFFSSSGGGEVAKI
jgi:hypothetical protein